MALGRGGAPAGRSHQVQAAPVAEKRRTTADPLLLGPRGCRQVPAGRGRCRQVEVLPVARDGLGQSVDGVHDATGGHVDGRVDRSAGQNADALLSPERGSVEEVALLGANEDPIVSQAAHSAAWATDGTKVELCKLDGSFCLLSATIAWPSDALERSTRASPTGASRLHRTSR